MLTMVSRHFEVHCDPFLVITQECQDLKIYKLYGITAILVLLELAIMQLNTVCHLFPELISF